MEEFNSTLINSGGKISVCVEDWALIPGSSLGDGSGRLYYSIFSLIVQYMIPFVTISILHVIVFIELKTHGKRRSHIIIQIENSENCHSENSRMKRNTAWGLLRILLSVCIHKTSQSLTCQNISTQAEGSNTPDTRWLGGIVCSSAESGHRLKLWLACLKVALSSPLWQPSKTSRP